jgi:hypothetical protein
MMTIAKIMLEDDDENEDNDSDTEVGWQHKGRPVSIEAGHQHTLRQGGGVEESDKSSIGDLS